MTPAEELGSVRPASVAPEEFRRALARHPAGVVVVTAGTGARPAGLTATSFTSVSLAPPLVLFCVDQGSRTWPAIRDGGRFAVNLLGAHQAELARRFARPGDRFAAPTRWSADPDGPPLLAGASGHLVCELHETVPAGDHWLVLGLVTSAALAPEGEPLLYHGGRFGAFVAEHAARAA